MTIHSKRNQLLGALAMILVATQTTATAATQVSAARLSLLSKGINADNIVNNSRMAVYTTDDLNKLKSMGINNIRIPIDPSYILVGVPVENESALSDAKRVAFGTARLNAHVKLFVENGFAVTLVLQPQRSFYALADTTSKSILLEGIKILTKNYANTYSPDQIFFEVLNEPHYDNASWNAFAPQITAAIRQIAPKHTIIVPPAWWDLVENFAALTPINDLNVVYTMHIYAPARMTGQGAGQVPPLPNYRFPKPTNSTDPMEWSYKRLDQYIHLGINWAADKKVPLIMNEFGATSVADPASRTNWVRFVRKVAEQNHIGWAYWAFDGRIYGLKPHGQKWDTDLVAALSN